MAADIIKVFIIGHEKDHGISLRLQTMLQGGVISLSHIKIFGPDFLTAGEDVPATTLQAMKDARFVILMLSSEFIIDPEEYLKKAFELHQDPASPTRILPVLARSCLFEDLGFDKLEDAEVLNAEHPLSGNQADDVLLCKVAYKIIDQIIAKSSQQSRKIRSPRDQRKFATLLTKLNYKEQPDQFQEAQLFSQSRFSNNKAFAYLIKGKLNYGQEWLYHILRKKTKDPEIWEEFEERDEVTFREIPLNFGSPTLKSSPEVIWNSLGKTLGISTFASQEQVVDKICNHLARTAVVLFRFDNFGDLNAEMGRDFMNNFWKPICQGAENPSDQKIRYPIFMFLIHQSESESVCVDTFLPSNSDQWEPQKGVWLKDLNTLSADEVCAWFENNKIAIGKMDNELLALISSPDKTKLQQLTEKIMENTRDGVPERVLSNVSSRFNFEFLHLVKQLVDNE